MSCQDAALSSRATPQVVDVTAARETWEAAQLITAPPRSVPAAPQVAPLPRRLPRCPAGCSAVVCAGEAACNGVCGGPSGAAPPFRWPGSNLGRPFEPGSGNAIGPRAALISPEHSLPGFVRYARVVGPDGML